MSQKRLNSTSSFVETIDDNWQLSDELNEELVDEVEERSKILQDDHKPPKITRTLSQQQKDQEKIFKKLKCHKYHGEWKLISSENLDQFLKKLKMSAIKIAIVKKLMPKITFTILNDGTGFKFTSKTNLKNSGNIYKWDEECDDLDPVGNEGRSFWSVEKKSMFSTHVMVGRFTYPNGKVIRIERKIKKDGTLKQVISMDGCECIRIFEKI